MKKSKEEIQRYIEQLEKQGIKPGMSAPLLFRTLWSLGINVRPPLSQSFLGNMLIMGFFFGLVWGVLMWFIQWRNWHLGVMSAVVASAAAGILFGASMAAYYRWKRRRVTMPGW